MIAIIDYGVGNLFSLCSSLKSIGAEAVVTPDPAVIRAADRVILPGVGAFADAAEKLRATGLDRVLLEEAANGKSDVLGHALVLLKPFLLTVGVVHAGSGMPGSA